jgi:hypothetical protein
MGACSSLEGENFMYDNNGYKINKQNNTYKIVIDRLDNSRIYHFKHYDDFTLFVVNESSKVFWWLGNNFPDNFKKKYVVSSISYITKVCGDEITYIVWSINDGNKIIKPQLLYERV